MAGNDESVSDINLKNHEIPSTSQNLDTTLQAKSDNFNMQLVYRLCEMFPDVCPRYIRKLCENKPMNDQSVNELITVVINTNSNYPKRPARAQEPDMSPENQFEILQELLPDADPEFLRKICIKYEVKPKKMQAFIEEAINLKNYPKLKDVRKRQRLSDQQKQYTSKFNIENFLKIIPDPATFFSDESRKILLDSSDINYALTFLRNYFNRLYLQNIEKVFNKNGYNLQKTFNKLELLQISGPFMKNPRKTKNMPKCSTNFPLLQEIAYLSHKKEINKYLEQKKQNEEAQRQQMKKAALMKTCNCCFDEEILPMEIYKCEKNCEFCKVCIEKSVQIRFGEGKLDFPCLGNCNSSFSLQTLQAVLTPNLFSKIAQKKALEEVKSAGIEGLEMCPFCDFATIPVEGNTVFTCLNPECMKESCRMCKEPSHIPLRCDEVEKDEDVRARVFVEDKMTEALLRKCWKCGLKFFKEEGCNKMTCSCGASMCYICSQPVKDYKHFNGIGGDRFDLCPLFTDNISMNKENVLKGAAEAKAKLGNVALKYDPTKDVSQHFEDRRKKNPQPVIPHQQPQRPNPQPAIPQQPQRPNPQPAIPQQPQRPNPQPQLFNPQPPRRPLNPQALPFFPNFINLQLRHDYPQPEPGACLQM